MRLAGLFGFFSFLCGGSGFGGSLRGSGCCFGGGLCSGFLSGLCGGDVLRTADHLGDRCGFTQPGALFLPVVARLARLLVVDLVGFDNPEPGFSSAPSFTVSCTETSGAAGASGSADGTGAASCASDAPGTLTMRAAGVWFSRGALRSARGASSPSAATSSVDWRRRRTMTPGCTSRRSPCSDVAESFRWFFTRSMSSAAMLLEVLFAGISSSRNACKRFLSVRQVLSQGLSPWSCLQSCTNLPYASARLCGTAGIFPGRPFPSIHTSRVRAGFGSHRPEIPPLRGQNVAHELLFGHAPSAYGAHPGGHMPPVHAIRLPRPPFRRPCPHRHRPCQPIRPLRERGS